MEVSLEELDKARRKGFRPVAVGCIVNRQKILFVYKREYDLWQLPQGGIDNRELIETTIKREMAEELGELFADSLYDFHVIGRDRIEFPKETQGSRDLSTDGGESVFMKGKRYYFVVAKTEMEKIEISEAEFDKYRWLDRAEAEKFAENIYQKGKKRITQNAIQRLVHRNLLK